jgi:hypothetical protein
MEQTKLWKLLDHHPDAADLGGLRNSLAGRTGSRSIYVGSNGPMDGGDSRQGHEILTDCWPQKVSQRFYLEMEFAKLDQAMLQGACDLAADALGCCLDRPSSIQRYPGYDSSNRFAQDQPGAGESTAKDRCQQKRPGP